MGARDTWARDAYQEKRKKGEFSSPGPLQEKLKGSKDKGGFLSRFSKGFTQFNKDINKAAHPVNLVKEITAFPRAVAGDLKADILGRPSHAVDNYIKDTFGGLKQVVQHPGKNPGNTAMLLASLAVGGKSLGNSGALSKAPMLNKQVPAYGPRPVPKASGRRAELVNYPSYGGGPLRGPGARPGTWADSSTPDAKLHPREADEWHRTHPDNHPDSPFDNGMSPEDAYHSFDHPDSWMHEGSDLGNENPFDFNPDEGMGPDPTFPRHGNPDGIGQGRYNLDRFTHGSVGGPGGRTHKLLQHLADQQGGYKNIEKTSRKFLADDVNDITSGKAKFNGTTSFQEYMQRGGFEPFDEKFMKEGKNWMEGPVKKKAALKALRALMEQGPGLPTRPYNGRN